MKKIGSWVLCTLLLVAGFAQTPALAHDCGPGETYETVTLPYCSFRVEYGDRTKTLWLENGWHHVRKLYVTAHSIWSNGGYLDVIVNGSTKRTIFVDNYSHEYTVEVGESTNSVQFRYSSGDYVDVTDVKAVYTHRYSTNDFNCGDNDYAYHPAPDFHSSLPSRNLASWLANRAIHNVDKLIPYADPETEYVPYLLPVKTVAGRAHATATAEGDLSVNTRTAMKALSAQIVFAEPVITALMKKPVSFDMAVELLSIKHEIDDRLH